MMAFYNIILLLGTLLGLPALFPILIASRKRRKTLRHRLGLAPLPMRVRRLVAESSASRPIWIHALSVGEVLTAVPLVCALKEAPTEKSIVFSVSTLTGFEIAMERLRYRVDGIVYFPYDLIFSVKRMISRINPAMMLIVETDLWPNFLCELKTRNIPAILVNARLSDHSLKGYLRLSFFMRPLFQSFAKVCIQSTTDFDRFRRLGISRDRLVVTGNIKFEPLCGAEANVNENTIRHRLKISSKKRIFLAGSTHPGEESILLEVFLRMKQIFSNLFFIVVPRDPGRAGLICREFQANGVETDCLSALNQIPRSRSIEAIVVDTIGMLRSLYAVADIAFVGGSLVNCGGHNPLEPAAFSKPILFGPDMSDFRDITRQLLMSNAAVQIRDATSLYDAAILLLRDKNKAESMGKQAYTLLCSNRGAIAKTLEVIRMCGLRL
jgi:3-deoxy-D-manno-octulosonic-acid transferase